MSNVLKSGRNCLDLNVGIARWFRYSAPTHLPKFQFLVGTSHSFGLIFCNPAIWLLKRKKKVVHAVGLILSTWHSLWREWWNHWSFITLIPIWDDNPCVFELWRKPNHRGAMIWSIYWKKKKKREKGWGALYLVLLNFSLIWTGSHS